MQLSVPTNSLKAVIIPWSFHHCHSHAGGYHCHCRVLYLCLVLVWVLWWQNCLVVAGRWVLWCTFYFLTAAFWRSGCFSSSGLHPSKSDVFNFLSPGDNLSIFFRSHNFSMSLAGSSLTAPCKTVLSWWKISFVPLAAKFRLHGFVRKRLNKSYVLFHLTTTSSVVWIDHCPANWSST